MRLALTLCFALIVAMASDTTASVLLFEDFEDNTPNGPGYTSDHDFFHDGIRDYYDIIPLNDPDPNQGNPGATPYTNFGGANFFAVEDIDDGGTRNSFATMTWNLSIAGATDLTFGGMFAAGENFDGTPSYDNNGNSSDDILRVTAQIDGGAIQDLFWISPALGTNQQVWVDTDFNGVGGNTGDVLATENFADQTISNLAIAGTGNNLALRIYVQSSDGSSEFAWDNIQINAEVIPEPGTFAMMTLFGVGVIAGRRRKA